MTGSMTTPAPVVLPTAPVQARALLALRWQMVRTPGVKLAMVVVLFLLVLLLQLVLRTGDTLDPDALVTAVDLAPQAFLGFAVLAVIAPLSAGGGTQVIPAEQLVAYPVRSQTHFLGGLVLAPANLVWVTQLMVLGALTSYLTLDGGTTAGLVTAVAYVAFITVLGQGLAWTMTGISATRAGRRGVLVASVSLLTALLMVLRLGHGRDVLAASPTRLVVDGIAAAGSGGWFRWGLTTLLLAAGAGAGLVLGGRLCAWALTRPRDTGLRTEGAGVRRRRQHTTAFRELLAVDRASVWRAPALRRGGIVLGLLPGLVAAAARVPWESLVVLPGLVAAGAGLLFGINLFSLDGSGAVWLATLPHDPRLALRAKLVTLTETVLGAVFLSLLAGSLRSPGYPTPAEAVVIVLAAVTCAAVTVAGCLSMSVRRPHRADLRGPRDAVAPPGALVVASVRLAVPCALVGVVLEGAAASGIPWLPPALALPVLVVAALSLRRSARLWTQPVQRARVVQVVSAG